MEQLARAGGVTKPSLYRHFRDRDGLITAIAERFGADLLSSVQAPLATELEQPQRVLQSTIDAYVGFIERDPHLYRFLIRHAPDRGAGLASVSALADVRSEENTSELQSLMRISSADFCLKKKKETTAD